MLTVSDDESDLNPSDIPPPPILRTNDELNLSVLRHHDPAIQSILSIAPYAVVYVFSALTQQWEKNGVEGCLFVCRLAAKESSVERYAVMVLNKRGLENFSAELLHGDDVEITNENVNIRVTESGGEQSIFGIWIFSEPPPSSTANARAINAQIIQDCAARAESSRKLAAKKPQAYMLESPGLTNTVEAADKNVRLSIRKPFDTQEVTSSTPTDQIGDTYVASEAFSLSADTEFFRSTSRTLRKA